MDEKQEDRWQDRLRERVSRRKLSLLAGGALVAIGLGGEAEAKKKKKKKGKKKKCTPESQATTCGGGKCGNVSNNCKQQVACGPCERFVFETAWGVFGSGNSQFVQPEGIAVDSSGNVYVADSSNDRIQKFDNNGGFILKWGGSGNGNGKFSDPRGVAVNAAGEVFVADTLNNRIQKFTGTGGYETQWNSDGTPETVFDFPAAIATGSDGSVYVSTRVEDSDFDGLRKFTPAGTFVSRLDGDPNTTIVHRGLAVKDGVIYASRSGSGESIIERIASTGEVIGEWGGESGSGSGQFSAPAGLALDADGNLYVADWGNDRVQVLSPSGAVIDIFGESGSGPGQFSLPTGIAVDGNGNIFVLDKLNERVQKFRPAGGAARRRRAAVDKGKVEQERKGARGHEKRRRGHPRRGRD